jgi:hypothetical protein
MQTIGTWLQLIGTATIGFGVVFAFLKVSGRLHRARVAVNSLVLQLISSLSPGRNVKQADVAVVVPVITEASAGVKHGGSLDDRLQRVENDMDVIRTRLDRMPEALRSEIGDDYTDTIASALQEISELGDAARWWDILPTGIGTLVSITGYICQLCA